MLFIIFFGRKVRIPLATPTPPKTWEPDGDWGDGWGEAPMCELGTEDERDLLPLGDRYD
jgi:hypothetical protein